MFVLRRMAITPIFVGFKIYNSKGYGLKIESDLVLSMSALHYFDEDLDDGDQKHQHHFR